MHRTYILYICTLYALQILIHTIKKEKDKVCNLESYSKHGSMNEKNVLHNFYFKYSDTFC